MLENLRRHRQESRRRFRRSASVGAAVPIRLGSAGLKAVQIQLPALPDHVTELLAASGAGLHKSVLPFTAKIRAAERAVQLQRQFFHFKARALVGRPLNHGFKAELKRFRHQPGESAIFDVHNLKTGTALTGNFLFRHFQQALCDSHFVHGGILAQRPCHVKAGSHSCHSA